ncbi:MAG: SIMPL domain-containing protein [Opitutaceae bacterium]|nr:SIMPL domain-containing protein [Cytophagales bacterium]
MKSIETFLIIVALSIASSTFGQTKVDCEEKPFIEVTGSADLEVIPDEIYINIIIREKYVNKEKVTIESQEEKLKTYLKDIGVDIKNLYLSDANADYVKVKWRTKDVLTKKDYTLKVSIATTVGQVFQQLDKLEIIDAFIVKVDHSKLDSLKKVVKILAIKAAKNKADYLLSAIGEQTGKPLIVQERENGFTSTMAEINIRGSRANGTASYIDGVKVSEVDEIQFKKIKIEAFIYVKFSIN